MSPNCILDFLFWYTRSNGFLGFDNEYLGNLACPVVRNAYDGAVVDEGLPKKMRFQFCGGNLMSLKDVSVDEKGKDDAG